MTRARLTLLAMLLFVPGLAFAQTNVAGDWDVTIQSPQGTNTVLVTLKQDGEKVSGLFKGPQGELPFEGGTLTGNDLKFAFTVNVQGNSIIISLTGKVDGAAISGKADFGGFGEGDWSAKRATAAASAAPAAPATTATQPGAASSTAGAGGKWDVTLMTPGGEFPATATLTDTAGKVTGTFGSQMGEVAVTGSVEGNAIKMTFVAQTPQGEMTVVMTGDVDGDSIVNGKADIAGMGQMAWSAKRAKQ
ncbi:MAG TPA: hypothetical protein VGX46_18405 [Vicinamibacterales bacterium]|jgi:hypothetical protein|nr:hypothetical protein [Vicinamibacterales bacterium]